MENRNAEAVIEDGCIVIRVAIANLQIAIDGGFACGAISERLEVLDDAAFAKDVANELNREEEDGTTPIHRLLDRAVNAAAESGSEWVRRHDEQEF